MLLCDGDHHEYSCLAVCRVDDYLHRIPLALGGRHAAHAALSRRVLATLAIDSPLWAENVVGWFRWAKTVSVLIPTAIFVGFARIARLHRENPNQMLAFFRGDWVLKVLYLVLFLNIAEATAKDFATANYFNALCGFHLGRYSNLPGQPFTSGTKVTTVCEIQILAWPANGYRSCGTAA